jgi:hypothetical protein
VTALLTVHGTFAKGPTHGANWWQFDSDFQRDIHRYVEAAGANSSELHFIPVPWDGSNQEVSRRKAGRKLFAQMRELEKAGESYSVIGHSHGGSVIHLALMEAVNRSHSLPGLVNWITVGTPFIALKKEPMLFSRVSYFGKSTLVTLVTFLILLLVAFYIDRMGGAFSVRTLVPVLVPFAAVYGVMALFNNRLYHLHRRSNWARFEEQFIGKWIALNHQDDEAIEGLGAIGRLKLELFGNRFAVPAVTFLGAVLVPVILLALIFSPPLMQAFEWLVNQENRFGPSNGNASANVLFIVDRLKSAAVNFANWAQAHMDPSFMSIANPVTRDYVEAVFSFVTLLIIPIIALLLIAYVLLALIGLLSIGVSYVLSKFLNWQVRGQIKSSAFGNNAIGEIATEARKTPFGVALPPPPPLPFEVARLISQFSDEEAIKALPKLRGVLKDLALSEGGAAKPDLIADYLSGYELIHTSYFRLPQFRKLVACIMAEGDGFQASQTLLADSEYDAVKSWLHQIITDRHSGSVDIAA